jgi:aminopeptidase N
MRLPEAFVEAVGQLLRDPQADPALIAEALALPSEDYLSEQVETVDVDGIHEAREFTRMALAESLREAFIERYQALADGAAYDKAPAAIGRRSLKNICLSYLANQPQGQELVEQQLAASDNMTDTLAALRCLVTSDSPAADPELEAFESHWSGDALVMDKWFMLQAIKPGHSTIERVKALMDHPEFSLLNPNKVRALIGVFSALNPTGFHVPDGTGYRFLADQVIALNDSNPQMAARMVAAFNRWPRYDEGRRALMKAELERVAAVEGLSNDVFEIVSNALKLGAPDDQRPAGAA